MGRIGITTTIPVETVYAAGHVPIDLNNVFVTHTDPQSLVSEAEREGYPRNTCGWIKGIYSTARRERLDAVIAVVEGDCSQTQAMIETLQMHGQRIIPFAFPYGRDLDVLRLHIEKLMAALGAGWDETLAWKRRLDRIRNNVRQIDELTWRNGTVSSYDNHYYQVCCSDFNRDPDAFEAEVLDGLAQAADATPREGFVRLGYVGIPPIFTDFYQFIESLGARVVFNEVQRQFSMPFETDDLVEQYALYTYPYDVFARIEDIAREAARRSVHGLIHYAQSFCFRQIQDLILRKRLDLPILTIEGDSPTALDARTQVRIESFVEMLQKHG